MARNTQKRVPELWFTTKINLTLGWQRDRVNPLVNASPHLKPKPTNDFQYFPLKAPFRTPNE
jgi:hypothetical protein